MDNKSQAQKKRERQIHIEVVRQMLTLATSGFGLVAALAWNNLVQEFVNSYIKKWLPNQGGLISLLIYAVVITSLAVMVTLQLSRLVHRLEQLEESTHAS